MNEFPVTLKPEDAPDPPDPQGVGIELMATLRLLADDTWHLRSLLTCWGDDPIAVMRRAQGRSIEIHDQAARALEAAETLMVSLRAARLLSVSYQESRSRES